MGPLPGVRLARDAMISPAIVLTTLGVGAAASPRFAPAGLLLEALGHRVMIDGGPGAVPAPPLDAWLVTDTRAELISAIRSLARGLGVEPRMEGFSAAGIEIECRPVVHTSHPSSGYLVRCGGHLIAWAPEFMVFPDWAAGADLLFADGAGWSRPIRFAGGAGGHLDVLAVATAARSAGVRRLVFAHLGRPTIRAIDSGKTPPFGEFGADGHRYRLSIPDPSRDRPGGPAVEGA